jgi:hypothetical protein
MNQDFTLRVTSISSTSHWVKKLTDTAAQMNLKIRATSFSDVGIQVVKFGLMFSVAPFLRLLCKINIYVADDKTKERTYIRRVMHVSWRYLISGFQYTNVKPKWERNCRTKEDALFGLVVGYTEHIQNVTTNNYDSLTELHTPKITVTTAHIKSSQSSLAVAL